MTKHLLLVPLALFTAVIAAGAAPAPSAAETEQSAPAPAESSQGNSLVKTKSTFDPGTATRSPFWPIGWTKVAVAGGVVLPAEVQIPDNALVVSSIVIDRGSRLAVINRQILGEGEMLHVSVGGQQAKLLVESIQDGKVILDFRGQKKTINFHR